MREPVSDEPISRDPIGTYRLDSDITSGHALDVVRELGAIDLDDLPMEIENAGPNVIFFAIVKARAKSKVRLSRLARDRAKSSVANDLRALYSAPSTKRTFTVDSIKDEAQSHPRVVAAEEQLAHWEEQSSLLEDLVEALKEKQRTLRAYTYGLARETSDVEAVRRLTRGETPDRRSVRS